MGVPAIIDNYVGKKLGGFLTELVTDLNPVQLNRANTNQKGPDIGGNIKAIRQLAKEGHSGPLNKGMSLKDYFMGKKIHANVTTPAGGDPSFKFAQGQNRFLSNRGDIGRASTRSIAAGAIGAYAVAPMVLGEDNFINRTIEAGAGFGVHAGITAAAIREGARTGGNKAAGMFGMAYGGLAAMNAIRSGNNLGPF